MNNDFARDSALLMRLRSAPYGGRLRLDDEGWSLRYRALDPADDYVAEMRDASPPRSSLGVGLSPLRAHLAALCRLVRDCDAVGLLAEPAANDATWEAVRYHLQMAASLEDLDTDTSYVDDTESVTYCEPAAFFESEHSEAASKYMAGLVVFNFVWAAYENAVELAAGDRLPRLKTGAKGREVLASTASWSDSVPFLRECMLACWRLCRACAPDLPLARDLDRFVPRLHGPFARSGGEIVRAFRNHVAHGHDGVPTPDDHREPGSPKAAVSVTRLHAASRLCLMLIQVLALDAAIDRDGSVRVAYVDGDDVERPLSRALTHVHVDEREAADDEPRLPLGAGWRLLDHHGDDI